MNDGITGVTLQFNNEEPITLTQEQVSRAAKRLKDEVYTGEDFTDPGPTRTTEFDHSLHSDEPKKDRPFIDGGSLASGLDYVLKATPARDDNEMLCYLHVWHDTAKHRIVITGVDGQRYHEAYVQTPADLPKIAPARWPHEDAAKVRDILKAIIKVGEYCAVRCEGIDQRRWSITYGSSEPMMVDVFAMSYGFGLELPRFQRGLGAGAAATHDAKLVSTAMALWGCKGVRVATDEVDSEGMRHIVLTDSAGSPLARAVVVRVGMREADPESPQSEIPGALGAADRTRMPVPDKKPKAKAKAKAAKKKARR
jgi:hypothetical protein